MISENIIDNNQGGKQGISWVTEEVPIAEGDVRTISLDGVIT